MKYANGFNPIKWDCETQGCFNKKCRPKIEVFADCFPGKNNFGDMDFIVERNGKALVLEWKSHIGEIPKGQEIMYMRLSKTGMFTFMHVSGNPETMKTKQYAFFYKGKHYGPYFGNLEDVKKRMRKWDKWTEQCPSKS